jgi:hypothetical protein
MSPVASAATQDSDAFSVAATTARREQKLGGKMISSGTMSIRWQVPPCF